MQVSNYDLLQITLRRNVNLTSGALNGDYVDGYSSVPVNESNLVYNSDALSSQKIAQIEGKSNVNLTSDVAYIGGKTVDISGVLSNNVKLAVVGTKASDLTPAELTKIKTTIYDLHHLPIPNGSKPSSTYSPIINIVPNSGNSGSIEGTGTEDTGTEGGNTNEPKNTFLKNQYANIWDTDSMFTYFNGIDSSITKSTGITRAQLISLTQEDDYEDDNYDFFGTLNRIFNKLDTNNDSKLSAAEIESFIGNELGSSVTVYMNKVTQFANEIQTYYSGLSNQKKLEYVLERTKEYLEAVGLTEQLAALNRLKSQTDTANPGAAKVGQIVMADLNPGYTSGPYTLGAYTYSMYPSPTDYETDGVRYDVGVWASDTDGENSDCGITLDLCLLEDPWYCLVDTLVHELTHATAYQYAGTSPSGYYDFSLFEFSEVTNLYNKGVLNTEEYNWYQSNWNKSKGSFSNDDYAKMTRLMYLINCQTGEYAAYQADADYVDSIAGDYLDGRNVMSTAVSGKDEKSTIQDHIFDLYDPADSRIADIYDTSSTVIKSGTVSSSDLQSANTGKLLYQDTDGDGVISKGDLIYEYYDGEWLASNAYEREAIPDYKWWTYRGALA